MRAPYGSYKLEAGVYGPLPTFFDDNQELDLISYRKHLLSELIIKRLNHHITNTLIFEDIATKGISMLRM